MYLVKLCFSDILLSMIFSKLVVPQMNAIHIEVIFAAHLPTTGRFPFGPRLLSSNHILFEDFLLLFLFFLKICIYFLHWPVFRLLACSC